MEDEEANFFTSPLFSKAFYDRLFREAVEQSGTAGTLQVFLAAAAGIMRCIP
jgi:hypothetical protein